MLEDEFLFYFTVVEGEELLEYHSLSLSKMVSKNEDFRVCIGLEMR